MPASDGDRVIIDFDPHSEEFGRDHEAILRRLRQEHVFPYSEHHGGFWVAASYEAVHAVLADPETFSVAKTEGNNGGLLIPPAPDVPGMIPAEVDPPEHTAYRDALAPAFTKKAVEKLTPLVQEVTAEIIDRMVALGDVDFVDDFANLLPGTTFIRWWGFPKEQVESFRLGTEEAFNIGRAPRGDEDPPDFMWMLTAICELAEERRKNPTDDLMTFLVNNPKMTFDEFELVRIGMNLLAGGIKTTAAGLSATLLNVASDPALRAKLLDDPGLIPQVTDESVRLCSPANSVARTVTKPASVCGHALEPGERIMLLYPSANRDESRYPDCIDLEHRHNHLGYGQGVHLCLGIWLAKLQLNIAIEQVMERIPNFEIDFERVQPFEVCGVLNGWLSIPGKAG
jgi:cytochrome P450